MLKKFLRSVGYFYLLRVPILCAGFLVLFPLLAVAGPLNTLFENLFDLDHWGLFWTAATAVLAAWSVVLTARLILVNGSSRFHLPQLLHPESAKTPMPLVVAIAAPTMAAPFLGARDFGYRAEDVGLGLVCIVCGIAFAYLVVFAGVLTVVFVAPPGKHASTVNAFPALPFLKPFLVEANQAGTFIGRWVTKATTRIRRLPPALWVGYLDPVTGDLWSGHRVAAAFGLVTFTIYAGVDVWKRLHLAESTHIPALVFVLWLVLIANWILSFATFFLDRFRIPLLVPFILAFALASRSSLSDHYFQVQKAGTHPAILARDVIGARTNGQKPIIVVATAGGGIQAALWTAKVLTELQKDSLGWNGTGKWPADFASSLAMISSVSGGATGAMFFLNEYRDGATPGFAPSNMDLILENAARSSLDDVAWALVDHDIPRLYSPYSLFPDARLIDRGRMLEMSWRRTGQVYANLADWRKGVVHCAACGSTKPWRPAAIFNSTIVETGRPLLLGTTDLLASAGQVGPVSFYDWVPDHDLPVVTAVRLAATFPYVSPAARPLVDSPAYHAVDGGYYDNPGVATLVAWLTEGLWAWDREVSANPERVKDMPPILVIQIRSFPDHAARKPTPKGVGFQLAAPADALLNVRTSGQVIRNDADLRRLQTRWMRPDHKTPVVQVATLQFNAPDAPLSWAINSRQIQAVQDEWNRMLEFRSDRGDPCTHGAPAPESDLQLVRCVMEGAKDEVCGCLMRRKEPW